MMVAARSNAPATMASNKASCSRVEARIRSLPATSAKEYSRIWSRRAPTIETSRGDPACDSRLKWNTRSVARSFV